MKFMIDAKVKGRGKMYVSFYTREHKYAENSW
jgi:hypothetical protein